MTPTDKTRVLIGLPVLDNIEMTRACLASLLRTTDTDRLDLAVEVLIVDNGSADDIAGLAEEFAAESRFPVHYLRNETNQGVAIAWNQMLRFDPTSGRAEAADGRFSYDYYVISNNDVIYGPDWLQPLVETLESDPRIGWAAALENGSPVLTELMESHAKTRRHHVDPNRPYTAETIGQSVEAIYAEWGGHDEFCRLIKDSGLPLFIENGQSAVCFIIRPAMVAQIGYFDEDYSPVGINEDLEYFLRMAKILAPPGLTDEVYPPEKRWRYGFCGRSVLHHNWCMTRQGRNFDGRAWDKQKEKNWREKFGKSRKYHSKLLPPLAGRVAAETSTRKGSLLKRLRRD